jgi:prophage DNA circulation protein
MSILDLSTYDQLTLNGIDCYLQSTTLNGGHKKISNEYPYRKERFVQDLGLLERKFTIIVITDDNLGFDDKNDLLTELESEGNIEMVHPEYGELQVQCLSYICENDYIQSAGISRFTINLEVASLNVSPLDSTANKGFLANLKSSILGKNEAKFDQAFKSVKNAKRKLDKAVKSIKKFATQMNALSRKIQGIGDSFSDFVTSINQVANSAKTLAQSPSVLASKIRDSFDNLQTAYSTSKDAFNVIKDLVGFNAGEQQAIGNSQETKDIVNNQNELSNLISANAMAIILDSAVNIDFLSVQDLQQVINDIESAFSRLPKTLDKEIYQDLLLMKVEANKVFSQLSLTLPNITDYEVINPISLNKLCYLLYGNLDKKDLLIALNNIQDTSLVSGTIKIFTNE